MFILHLLLWLCVAQSYALSFCVCDMLEARNLLYCSTWLFFCQVDECGLQLLAGVEHVAGVHESGVGSRFGVEAGALLGSNLTVISSL
jgi:hypothetical protein